MNWQQARAWFHWASLRDKLQTSLWVIPVTYTVGAGFLAAALLRVDEQKTDYGAWFLAGGQAEGARELLGTIASSMLTIATLVFSITILVLQLASSQYSPRILRTFLQDRLTQNALGFFLGTFVFAMVVLPWVRSPTEAVRGFVPGLSVFCAFAFALISVGLFVRYIHHMAHSIRVTNIMFKVSAETHRSLLRLYPDSFCGDPSDERVPPPGASREVANTREGGVVISVAERALMKLATEHDLVIALIPEVGTFVPCHAPLFRIWGHFDADERELCEHVALARERTPHQDAIFGFRQLVDIAERALSPGVNDPTTATQALDHLHDLLRALARRQIPQRARLDPDGVARLFLPRPCWDDYVRLSFEEICHYGAGSIQVLRRTRLAIEDLLATTGEARAAVLREQLGVVGEARRRSFPHLSP